jgi:hypothetical protein
LTLRDLEAEPDTFVFRESKGKFLVLTVNEKNRVVLGGFEGAKIKLGNPLYRKQTSNIVYNLNSSTISDLTPEVVLRTTVRNDSPSYSFQSLSYRYLISHTGSWTNAIGVPLPSNVVSKAKIPCLMDGNIIIAENYSHDVETKSANSSIAVPASTRGVATVLIYRALIQVPFTYTEEVWYTSGDNIKATKHGTYSNIETYGVDVELTDMVSITHGIDHQIP